MSTFACLLVFNLQFSTKYCNVQCRTCAVAVIHRCIIAQYSGRSRKLSLSEGDIGHIILFSTLAFQQLLHINPSPQRRTLRNAVENKIYKISTLYLVDWREWSQPQWAGSQQLFAVQLPREPHRILETVHCLASWVPQVAYLLDHPRSQQTTTQIQLTRCNYYNNNYNYYNTTTTTTTTTTTQSATEVIY